MTGDVIGEWRGFDTDGPDEQLRLPWVMGGHGRAAPVTE
jgi:hypothetical protein